MKWINFCFLHPKIGSVYLKTIKVDTLLFKNQKLELPPGKELIEFVSYYNELKWSKVTEVNQQRTDVYNKKKKKAYYFYKNVHTSTSLLKWNFFLV